LAKTINVRTQEKMTVARLPFLRLRIMNSSLRTRSL